jgi:hypothetical protein
MNWKTKAPTHAPKPVRKPLPESKAMQIIPPPKNGVGAGAPPAGGHKTSFFDRDGDGRIDAIQALKGFHAWRAATAMLGIGIILGFGMSEWAAKMRADAANKAVLEAVSYGTVLGRAQGEDAAPAPTDYQDDKGWKRGRPP